MFQGAPGYNFLKDRLGRELLHRGDAIGDNWDTEAVLMVSAHYAGDGKPVAPVPHGNSERAVRGFVLEGLELVNRGINIIATVLSS
jgi:hypothetical protein